MSKILVLPRRKGEKPQTGPAIPHQQLSQISPIAIQEDLWKRMVTLEGTIEGRSHVSMPDSRALHLSQPYANGPQSAFMVGHEFMHLHGHEDGSLHMTLPPKDVKELLDKGWGEVHPLARNQPEPTLVMVFGPRDDEELEIVWTVVKRSYAYAKGMIA